MCSTLDQKAWQLSGRHSKSRVDCQLQSECMPCTVTLPVTCFLVFCLLQELTGKGRLEVTHLMHARVTGSYLRGRRTCGDIDFIISPGPATANLVGLGPLMQGILTRLAAQHFITEVCDMGHPCAQDFLQLAVLAP